MRLTVRYSKSAGMWSARLDSGTETYSCWRYSYPEVVEAALEDLMAKAGA